MLNIAPDFFEKMDIKPIKDYALNNSDVFNESQEEVISNFISNFDNFNQNVDDLNNNYDMDQKLNLIII